MSLTLFAKNSTVRPSLTCPQRAGLAPTAKRLALNIRPRRAHAPRQGNGSKPWVTH